MDRVCVSPLFSIATNRSAILEIMILSMLHLLTSDIDACAQEAA